LAHRPVRVLPDRRGRVEERFRDLRLDRTDLSYRTTSENTIVDAKASRDIHKLAGGQRWRSATSFAAKS
jgi:hypothetical protein